MLRREFIRYFPLLSSVVIPGCALYRIDPWHVLIRSDRIKSLLDEAEILKKAGMGLTKDGKVRVLYVKGSPYERGYQHGVLLRDEIRDNLQYLYKQAIKKFHFEEFFFESYERVRPFIPEEYIEEMHGLAHGSRLPLYMIHHIHVMPSMSEWGGRKAVKIIIKNMMKNGLGSSCSNFTVRKSDSANNSIYAVRILDWGIHKISKLQHYPLITVSVPEKGIPSANIGWVGFVGAVSGINAEGITLGEMGYGDPENETLRGKPMIFLLRDVLSYASCLKDVRKIISGSVGTNSFGFVMSDGKTNKAELYIRDRDRFLVFKEGQTIRDGDEYMRAIAGIVYGGHYNEKMTYVLLKNNGKFSLEELQEVVVPEFAMKSNFQNVIYDPEKLQFWMNVAKSKDVYAARQPYTFFDFGSALKGFLLD